MALVKRSSDQEGDPTNRMYDTSTSDINQYMRNWKATTSDKKSDYRSSLIRQGFIPIYVDIALYSGYTIWFGVASCKFLHYLTLLYNSPSLRAKYSFSIFTKALKILLSHIESGIDINCGFKITAENSSLPSQVIEKSHKFVVNAFHGYSHNYQCQIKNHFTVILRVDIEDFKMIKWIFSTLNALTIILWYILPYYYQIIINAFFYQWN